MEQNLAVQLLTKHKEELECSLTYLKDEQTRALKSLVKYTKEIEDISSRIDACQKEINRNSLNSTTSIGISTIGNNGSIIGFF